MRIINLIENTSARDDLTCEFGLSFYIETKSHKVLLDMGAGGQFLENAVKMGIDLKKVDTAVLSHGHYDHGNGLPAFMEINKHAKIYIKESAFEKYYAESGDGYEYIGIPSYIQDSKQIVIAQEYLKIDEELCLFSGVTKRELQSQSNNCLKIYKDNAYLPDSFSHEQCLVVTDEKKKALFSSCSHCGIVNILDKYEDLFGTSPDLVVGGFHLVNPGHDEITDEKLIKKISQRLLMRETLYYTCHCTGLAAFNALKHYMGDRIRYVATGDNIE